MELAVQKLTQSAFAPYGEVLAAPETPGREYFDSSLASRRADAWPSLSLVLKLPIPRLPIDADLLERHEFSSQTFVPLDVSRWLIVVCPHAPGGGPDVSRALAFLAAPDQGITYRMNVWHHGLTVLDRPARFAVLMWRNGTARDEEFVPVPRMTVHDRGH
jgi:ureidoglycolate lyase